MLSSSGFTPQDFISVMIITKANKHSVVYSLSAPNVIVGVSGVPLPNTSHLFTSHTKKSLRMC